MIDRKIVIGVCCFLVILLAFLIWLWVNHPQIVFALAIILLVLAVCTVYVKYRIRKARAKAIYAAMKLEEEKRKRREQFEQAQWAKGLQKFVDRYGNLRWGTPEQVQAWQRDAKEQELVSKGVAARDKEIDTVRCSYCNELYEESLKKCPNCGAPR